jgi:hypothetical protein
MVRKGRSINLDFTGEHIQMNLLTGRIEPKLLLPAPQHRRMCARCGTFRHLTRSHVPQRWLFNWLRSQTPKKNRDKDFPAIKIKILCKTCHALYTRFEFQIVQSSLVATARELIVYHEKFEHLEVPPASKSGV